MTQRPIGYRISLLLLSSTLAVGWLPPQVRDAAPPAAASPEELTTLALRGKVDTIVVIYAENRAFDNLYGDFPGARNLSEVLDAAGRPLPAYHPQVDRDGRVLPHLPPAWGGVTASGV